MVTEIPVQALLQKVDFPDLEMPFALFGVFLVGAAAKAIRW